MKDAPGSVDAEACGLLTVDLAAIVANWRELGRRADGAECAGVVKADAYGCGLEQVSAALATAGCETLFVANLAEGRRVRGAAPGATVYVLSGLVPGTAEAFADANLRPVLGSLAEIAEWDAFVAAHGWSGGAALHVDTGMNRLGLDLDAAATLAAALRGRVPHTHLTLVMSHLACAETPEHPLNARQIAAFREVRALFPGVPGSLANSSGIFLGPDALHDMVRPGVALYGGNPTPGHLNPMRPVVRLDGRVLQVREVEAGDTVGYGATWTAKNDARIAVVGIGYADGILRAASGSDDRPGAEVMVAGEPCRVAGRISMDLMAIDVTALPDDRPRRGDLVTLIGDEIGVDDLASHAGTIGYEILTSLGRRYRRVWRSGA